MFDTDNPCCPTCQSEMYDNRESKRQPNLPDFKCKNKNCVDTKGYNTGVYLPKAKGPAPAAKPAPVANPIPAQVPKPLVQAPMTPKPMGRGDYGNGVPPSMYGAWSMDMVVALVGQGKVTSVADGILAYKEALKGVGQALEANKVSLDALSPVPVAQQEKQVAKPAPVAAPAPVAREAQPPVTRPEDIPDPMDVIAQELGQVSGEISIEDLSNLDL